MDFVRLNDCAPSLAQAPLAQSGKGMRVLYFFHFLRLSPLPRSPAPRLSPLVLAFALGVGVGVWVVGGSSASSPPRHSPHTLLSFLRPVIPYSPLRFLRHRNAMQWMQCPLHLPPICFDCHIITYSVDPGGHLNNLIFFGVRKISKQTCI